MKKILLTLFVALPSLSFANGFNNDDLEKIARKAFIDSEINCQIENEAPVIKHRLMDNYITRTTLDFGYYIAEYDHGIDGVGIVRSQLKCVDDNDVTYISIEKYYPY